MTTLLCISALWLAVAAPGRQPQLAASKDFVAMTYGSGSTIYFAGSRNRGATFDPPVKVAEVSSLALGRHRGPRIAILPNGGIVVTAVVNEKKESDLQAGDLMAWRSADSGKTWSRGGVVNDVSRAAREGLHAMTALPDGGLYTVWLDLRSKGTKLYGARSEDGGLTWSRNMLVYESPDGTICQCCHPTLAVGPKGQLTVMWRNALGGSRDLYAATSLDGGKSFRTAAKLGKGTWKLDACPMDGGGLAVDESGIASAWRRESEIYLTEPGAEERRIAAGKDVALARTRHGTYLAWVHERKVWALLPGKSEPFLVTEEGGFPVLSALDDGSVLVAWESKDSIGSMRLATLVR